MRHFSVREGKEGSAGSGERKRRTMNQGNHARNLIDSLESMDLRTSIYLSFVFVLSVFTSGFHYAIDRPQCCDREFEQRLN